MKRANGEGTIFKRKDGRWCGAYYIEEPFLKRCFVYGRTQAEVRKKLEDIKTKPILENEKEGNNYVLSAWIQQYLVNYKIHEVKLSTYTSYEELYRKHLKNAYIGRIRLSKLTTSNLQSFYNSKVQDGYNPKTIKHMHVLINSALNKAVQLQMIKQNVNTAVSLPKKKTYEAKTLSVEEVQKLLNDAKDERLYALVIFTIFSGLRKGEVLALRWQDVDFENREVHIRNNLCRVGAGVDENGRNCHTYKLMTPKTQKSIRTIPLLKYAMDALLKQQIWQNEQKEKYAMIYQDQDFVFTREDGSHLDPRGMMDDFHKLLNKYEITDVRFHDLRHTFATLLLQAGENIKVIQELMGHSTITTTMDIYSHITKESKVEAMKSLEAMNAIGHID